MGLSSSGRDGSETGTPLRSARLKMSAANTIGSSSSVRKTSSVKRPASSLRNNITAVGTKSATQDSVYAPVYGKNDPIAFSVTQRRAAGAGGQEGGGVDPTVRMPKPNDYPKDEFFF